MQEDNFRVGIIGGAGKMGRLFHSIFERRGYEVYVSDLGIGLSLKDLAETCKVLILAVPMEVFSHVVRDLAPFVKDHHWIMDICSLKVEPSRVMKRYLKKGELLATHPLFGPFEETLRGRTVAIYPLRGKRLFFWFKSLMEEEGLKVVKISPKKHDQIMGLVQVINHLWLILLAKLIHDTGLQTEDLINLSTPSFLSQLMALSRLSKQDEELYAKIQLANPYGKRFRKLLCRNCAELVRALNRREEEGNRAFREYFRLAKTLAKEFEVYFYKYKKED